MSKTKISHIERWGVWQGHKCKCCYCSEPLELSNVHIDHVIPESYAERPELANILVDLDLSEDFDLNSLENLVPVHNRCNLQKGDLIFDTNSIRFFHNIAKSKVDAVKEKVEEYRKKIQSDKKKDRVLASIENRIVDPMEVWAVLKEIEFVPPDMLDVSDIIDDLAGLFENHRYTEAIAALEQVKKKRWDSLPQQAKYKLTLNYGIAYFNLDQKQKGAEYFIELQNYCTQSDSAAYGCIALGYAIKDDVAYGRTWAIKSLAIDPKSLNAGLALVFLHEGEITPNNVDDIISPALQQIPIIAVNIGLQFDRRGYIEQAYKIYTDLEKNYQHSDIVKSEIWSQLAYNRILSLSQKAAHSFGQISENDKEILQYALKKLNAAVEVVKDTQFAPSKWYLWTNRGAVKRILQDLSGAIDDFTYALQLQKNFFTYRHLLNFYKNDAEKASALIAEMEKIPLSKEESRQLLVTKAEFGMIHGQISDELLSAFTVELDDISFSNERVFWQAILIELLIKRQLLENALIFASQMTDDELAAGNGHMFRAKIFHLLKKDKVEILAELDAAMGKPGITDGLILIVEIFELLTAYGQYQRAIDLLLPHTDLTQCSDLTKRVLIAYFTAGNYKKCIEILEPLFARDENDFYLIEFLVQIYDSAGLPQRAIDILEKQVKRVGKQQQLLMNLALLYTKVDDYQRALQLIMNVENFSGMPPSFQFLIAHIYEKSGMQEKALSVALQIRATNYNSGEVHRDFTSFVLSKKQDASQTTNPEKIKIGCFFKLLSEENKVIERIIVESASNNNEIDSFSSMYQKVVGKQVGDVIEFAGDDYRISEILTIETYALRDSLKQLEIIYGDKSPIKTFKFKNDSGEDMLHQISNAVRPFLEKSKQLEDIYKEGLSTIGCNANILGLSPVQYWQKLTRTPEVGIFSLDNGQPALLGLEKLKSEGSIAIDITALLTLFYIDALKLLTSLPNKFYVSSLTIAHIEAELAELSEMAKQAYISHTKEVDGKIETTIERQAAIKSRRDHWAALVALVKHHFEIVQPEISEDIHRRQQRDRVLEASFNATAEIAKTKNAILYSDDQKFKKVIWNEDAIACLSSLALLTDLRMSDFLSVQQYNDCLYQLALLNYRDVPMSADSLYRISVHNKLVLTRQLMNSLDRLTSAYCDDATGVTILILFLYQLYTNRRIIGPRGAITEYAVSKVLSGRNVRTVKEALLVNVKKKFSLLPLEYVEIKKIINKFY